MAKKHPKRNVEKAIEILDECIEINEIKSTDAASALVYVFAKIMYRDGCSWSDVEALMLEEFETCKDLI